MDDAKNYYSDGVARVLKLLKDTFGDTFKEYYDDEPIDIPESRLPCIMVKETTGGVRSGAAGTDDIGEEIVIIVAMNTKDDLGASTDSDLTGSKLRRIVKGQYPPGHAREKEYQDETVMAVIRKNFTLEDAIIDNFVRTDFDLNQRGDTTYTKEAYVTLTIERLAHVPSRT